MTAVSIVLTVVSSVVQESALLLLQNRHCKKCYSASTAHWLQAIGWWELSPLSNVTFYDSLLRSSPWPLTIAVFCVSLFLFNTGKLFAFNFIIVATLPTTRK